MADDSKPPAKSIEDLLRLFTMEQDSEEKKKEMQDYKFWKTQPVPSFDEKVDREGPIDSSKTPDDIPDTPLPLISSFEWCNVDVTDDKSLDEVYKLLFDNYVEDLASGFRFQYSPSFLRWALQPPGWRAEWHLGVRVKESGKLVAFVAGIPMTLHMNRSNTTVPSAEINFLCVHKQLRAKRLAPVMIKEITRRINKQNIWQALYTAGVVLPSPVSTSRYMHRPINWSKLYEVGFSQLPRGQSVDSMNRNYELPETTSLSGWRPMAFKDVEEVHTLLHDYQKKFDMVQLLDKADLAHWLLGNSKEQETEISDVIKCFVVEDDEGHITDFISYFLLPFTVLGNDLHKDIGIAYLFLYASKSDGTPEYKNRLCSLVNDALVTSRKCGVDVFNCLTSQDNTFFTKLEKFSPGDGLLNYYLFNYKTWPMNGGIDPETKEPAEDTTSGIGVFML